MSFFESKKSPPPLASQGHCCFFLTFFSGHLAFVRHFLSHCWWSVWVLYAHRLYKLWFLIYWSLLSWHEWLCDSLLVMSSSLSLRASENHGCFFSSIVICSSDAKHYINESLLKVMNRFATTKIMIFLPDMGWQNRLKECIQTKDELLRLMAHCQCIALIISVVGSTKKRNYFALDERNQGKWSKNVISSYTLTNFFSHTGPQTALSGEVCQDSQSTQTTHLRWEPPSFVDRNGQIIRYEVTYTLTRTAGLQISRLQENMTVAVSESPDVQNQTVVVAIGGASPLEAGSTYDVFIRACNSLTCSDNSAFFYFVTAEDRELWLCVVNFHFVTRMNKNRGEGKGRNGEGTFSFLLSFCQHFV